MLAVVDDELDLLYFLCHVSCIKDLKNLVILEQRLLKIRYQRIVDIIRKRLTICDQFISRVPAVDIYQFIATFFTVETSLLVPLKRIEH